MSSLTTGLPTRNARYRRRWQTLVPLAVGAAAALVGYVAFGRVERAEGGGLLAEATVLGGFIAFAALFLVLNRDTARLDGKAGSVREEVADAVRESDELGRTVAELRSRRPERG